MNAHTVIFGSVAVTVTDHSVTLLSSPLVRGGVEKLSDDLQLSRDHIRLGSMIHVRSCGLEVAYNLVAQRREVEPFGVRLRNRLSQAIRNKSIRSNGGGGHD